MPSTTGDQRAVRLGLGLGEARRGHARLQQRWQRGVGEGLVLTELRGAWWLQTQHGRAALAFALSVAYQESFRWVQDAEAAWSCNSKSVGSRKIHEIYP